MIAEKSKCESCKVLKDIFDGQYAFSNRTPCYDCQDNPIYNMKNGPPKFAVSNNYVAVRSD